MERGQNGFLKTTRAGERDIERGRMTERQLGSLPSSEERNERQQVGQASERDKDLKKQFMGEM